MKHIAAAFAALLTLGSAGVATAGPIEPDDSILFNQLVEEMTVVQQETSKPMSSRSGGREVLEPDLAKPVSKPIGLIAAMAPRIDATQPPAKIAPPIVAGTVREDPPGTGINRDSNKDKKKGWFQRKFFGR